MHHPKKHHSTCFQSKYGQINVEGPVSIDRLSSLSFHPGLVAFRPAPEQHRALIQIAELPEARIIIAAHKETIIGYITFLHPDPLERWSEIPMDNLLELGAVEVASDYRNIGLGKKMLEIAFLDPAMEDYIIYTTEYYWHWDLNNSKLDVWEYRNMMEKMMNSAGLEWAATDDPEICAHPANCLMVRIGKRVPLSSIKTFDRLRFNRRIMY